MPNNQEYNPSQFTLEQLKEVFEEAFHKEDRRRVVLNWDTLGPGARAAINEAIRKEFEQERSDKDPEALSKEGEDLLTD